MEESNWIAWGRGLMGGTPATTATMITRVAETWDGNVDWLAVADGLANDGQRGAADIAASIRLILGPFSSGR